MPRPTLPVVLARALAAAGLLLANAALPAQAAPAPLGKAATESLCARFTTADHWMQKVVLLLSLNGWWHPAGTAMVTAAVQDKDERLRAFGVEALLRSDDELLPMVATPELLDELIQKQLAASNTFYRERAEAALKKLAPAAAASGKTEWARWWRDAKATWQPAAWVDKSKEADAGSGTVAVAQRAFDLYQDGLDLMICIDSTGSMQPTIDALAAALSEMVDILDGISPKLRIGIVHYKDHGELGKEGAKAILPLTKNVKSAAKQLEDLRAVGGGDLPEAVLGGLELALGKTIKWQADANKIVILVGDAPPHPDEYQACIDLVKTACENPGSQGQKTPATGAKSPEKPFLTSAIGVFLKIAPGVPTGPGYQEFVDSQRTMKEQFQAIAKAGGGVFVEVEFEITSATPPTSKERRETAGQRGSTAAKATRQIVEHILVLSFGERFAKDMHEFVRIYYEYKEAEWFK